VAHELCVTRLDGSNRQRRAGDDVGSADPDFAAFVSLDMLRSIAESGTSAASDQEKR